MHHIDASSYLFRENGLFILVIFFQVPLPPVTTAANEIPKDNQSPTENQESSSCKTSPSPTNLPLSVNETEIDKEKSSTDLAKPEAAIDETVIDKDKSDNDKNISEDGNSKNNVNNVDKKNVDNSDTLKNNEDNEFDKESKFNDVKLTQECEESAPAIEKEVLKDDCQVMNNFQDILNLRPISDKDRLKKKNEKLVDGETDKYKYILGDTDMFSGTGGAVDNSYEFPEGKLQYTVCEMIKFNPLSHNHDF